MSVHPALTAGEVAVVTGAASGLGLAAAQALGALGLNVWMVDLSADALEAAAAPLRRAHPGVTFTTQACDVSDAQAMLALSDTIYQRHPRVAFLMNNAGVGSGGSALERPDDWRRVLGVNLFGVLNGVQAFGPRMAAQAGRSLIVNTGSKQGITTPPGDTAYNVSKAGVKALTEGLAHTLRETPGCEASAHLFVPGFVWTGLTARGRTDKPAGAWTPEQTIAHLFARLAQNDFYIVCPDNETSPETDARRIAWAAGDLVDNRPALSRWHADWRDRFAAYMASDRGPALR